MKKLMLFAVLMMVSVLNFAQPAPAPKKTPGQRADEVTARIDKQLSLSAKQRMDVHRLAFVKEQKMEKMTVQKGMSKELMDKQRRKINEEFRNGMKSVLTADQYAKWMKHKRLIGHKAAKAPKAPMKMRRETATK